MTTTEKIQKKYEKKRFTWSWVAGMNQWWLGNGLVTSADIRKQGEKYLVTSYTKNGIQKQVIRTLKDAKTYARSVHNINKIK